MLKTKIRHYWPLIKSLQTALLLITGLAGYMSARCPIFNLSQLLALTASLFLAISGSTVVNMWYDRDIDAKMKRTCQRPIPAGHVKPSEALILGLSMSIGGIGWAFLIDALYGLIVLAGFFFDVVVYTILLKRKTAWSIVWGGISGGMPVLAGRVLGVGKIEWIGIVFALAILFWIPTHILTFNLRYKDDYQFAGIPTFPSLYGNKIARNMIAISSVLAGLLMIGGAIGIGIPVFCLRLMAILSVGLLAVAVLCVIKPSDRTNFGLFKFASIYMLSAMFLLFLSGFI
jgi:protoheme IX farnesyltransferase